jgi:multidrug efflux pump subunit AcrB
MASHHSEVEYTTADGNDYKEHESTYLGFLQFSFVGAVLVINIVLALAVGSVGGHWFIALVTLVLAHIFAAFDLITGGKTMSYVALAGSLLSFALFISG